MGDFNINPLNCLKPSESSCFLLMLNSYFLLPYILQLTCITERSATLINDNICNYLQAANGVTSGNLVLRISDHLPQFLIVDNVKVNQKTLNYYKNDYSKFDEEKFINNFSLLDWANIFNNDLDANNKFDVFNDQISQFINCHAPCRKLSKHEIKLSTTPWITKDILAKIRYRDKLYSQIMKSIQPDPNLLSFHKRFRNSCVVKDIKASKPNYLNNYFLCNRNNILKNLVRNQINHKHQ